MRASQAACFSGTLLGSSLSSTPGLCRLCSGSAALFTCHLAQLSNLCSPLASACCISLSKQACDRCCGEGWLLPQRSTGARSGQKAAGHALMPGTPRSLFSLALRASWSALAVCTACTAPQVCLHVSSKHAECIQKHYFARQLERSYVQDRLIAQVALACNQHSGQPISSSHQTGKCRAERACRAWPRSAMVAWQAFTARTASFRGASKLTDSSSACFCAPKEPCQWSCCRYAQPCRPCSRQASRRGRAISADSFHRCAEHRRGSIRLCHRCTCNRASLLTGQTAATAAERSSSWSCCPEKCCCRP